MANEKVAATLDEAEKRIETLLVVALGARHPALDDWAVIRFAINKARAKSSQPAIAQELRSKCAALRVKPIPLAELIPLMQRAADALGSPSLSDSQAAKEQKNG